MKTLKIIKKLFLLIFILFFIVQNANAANRSLSLALLYTNDIHGAIDASFAYYLNPEFPPKTGNLASIKTILNNYKTLIGSDTYLLLDAGDFFQGTPLSNLSKGEAVIDIFNELGYTAVCPGNHDFDMGFDNLKNLAKILKANLLCCNIFEEAANTIPEIFKPYIIQQIENLKIGIIGVITDDMPRLSSGQNIKGLKFINSAQAVSKYVDILKTIEKCDIIIVLSHLGFEEDKILASKVKGIDIIIGGHSHTGVRKIYNDPENHTLITQAFSKGGTLGNLTLIIDLDAKKILNFKHELISLFSDQFPPDKKILERIKYWKDKYEKGFDDVIGYTKYNLQKSSLESNLGNLICDALMHRYGVDVAFQNSGGIRAEIKKGNITLRDIFNVLPFDNEVMLLKMTGAELAEALEVSVLGTHGILQVGGVEMVFNPKAPRYKKVKSAKVKGQPIDKDKIYTVATNSYLIESEGATYAVFKGAQYIENTHDVLRDVVIDYIRQKKNIEVEIEGRIKTE